MTSDTMLESLVDFLKEKYLTEYIAHGGSKIKFVTGKTGSGKTFFINRIIAEARDLGYITVSISAKNVWLHDFRSLYLEILEQCDLMQCLEKCGDRIMEEMGYSPDLPDNKLFIDYLAENDAADALNKREIRTQLRQMFLENARLDNNFALACSMLTGGLLGYPLLEEPNKEILLSWIHDDRTVKLNQLRGLGLSPGRVTKYNSRNMLRSLIEVIHMSGYKGLLVCVDDLDILISKSSLEEIHYTKMKREDTYESIRQLIDDIDTMHNVFFVFAYHRQLQDDENSGLKSYQALWMRIQNEVNGSRFNKFADIIDLDMLVSKEYSVRDVINISGNIHHCLQDSFYEEMSSEQAERILEKAKLGGVGVPGLIVTGLQGGTWDE